MLTCRVRSDKPQIRHVHHRRPRGTGHDDFCVVDGVSCGRLPERVLQAETDAVSLLRGTSPDWLRQGDTDLGGR